MNSEQLSMLSTSVSNNTSSATAVSAAAVRVGDWICLICNNLNYSFRHSCNRCRVQTKSNNFYQQLLMMQQDNKQISQVINQQQQQPSQQYQPQQFMQATDQRKQIVQGLQQHQQEQPQVRCWNEIQYESLRQQQQKSQELLCSSNCMGQNKQEVCQKVCLYADKENLNPQLPSSIPKGISVSKLQLREPLKQQKSSQVTGIANNPFKYDEESEEFHKRSSRFDEDNNFNTLENSNCNLPRIIIDSLQGINERNSHKNNEKEQQMQENNSKQSEKLEYYPETLAFFASASKKELGTRGFEHCLYVTPPRRGHSTGEGNSGSSSLDIESIVKRFRLMYGTTEKHASNEREEQEESNNNENSQRNQVINNNDYSQQSAISTCGAFSLY